MYSVIILYALCDYSACILWIFCMYFVDIMLVFCDYSVCILWLFCMYYVNMLYVFCEYSVCSMRTLCDYSVCLLWIFCMYSVNILYVFCTYSVCILYIVCMYYVHIVCGVWMGLQCFCSVCAVFSFAFAFSSFCAGKLVFATRFAITIAFDQCFWIIGCYIITLLVFVLMYRMHRTHNQWAICFNWPFKRKLWSLNA